ncbi:MAG TPA: ATP-dependent DNA ligase [Bryobacteraceae bacterium]|nr:ATP-dependent DNA ligase [Bryobacteraceae bacterium]
MLLRKVVDTSRGIAETSKRTVKVTLAAELLRQLAPEEIRPVAAYLSGVTRQGRIGIGYAILRDTLGSPAPEPLLSVMDLDSTLDRLAETRGSREKQNVLRALMARATEGEQQFLTALLVGELRQGALEGLMIDALAKASGIAIERVRRGVMMAGDFAAVAQAVLTEGEAALSRYDVQLFRPVQPMLAQTAEDAGEAIRNLGEAALEFKLDGARVQVHRSGDEVRVYSRQLNDVTAAVPEIVEAVRTLPGQDLILDGEVLSLRPDGRPEPFQVTMRRFGRKLDVESLRAQQALRPFWFDLLYLDGSSLMDEAQAKRFTTLRDLAGAEALTPNMIAHDEATAVAFMKLALAQGHEGIVAKAPDATYAAGARGGSWLKVKQANTLDLVILAAEWGHGRRRGWLSNLHLGARDTAKGGFAMLGKTFKGLTDEMLAWQTNELLKHEISRDAYTVYVEPKLVAEIAFNEVQVSSTYPSGLALRFARVKRYRTDKTPDQADTFEAVQRIAGIV